jgi:hypothetical protein
VASIGVRSGLRAWLGAGDRRRTGTGRPLEQRLRAGRGAIDSMLPRAGMTVNVPSPSVRPAAELGFQRVAIGRPRQRRRCRQRRRPCRGPRDPPSAVGMEPRGRVPRARARPNTSPSRRLIPDWFRDFGMTRVEFFVVDVVDLLFRATDVVDEPSQFRGVDSVGGWHHFFAPFPLRVLPGSLPWTRALSSV